LELSFLDYFATFIYTVDSMRPSDLHIPVGFFLVCGQADGEVTRSAVTSQIGQLIFVSLSWFNGIQPLNRILNTILLDAFLSLLTYFSFLNYSAFLPRSSRSDGVPKYQHLRGTSPR
jgi:hypothetical protein